MAPPPSTPPPRAKPAHRPVRGADRISLLASPVRQDLVDTLEALGGEASVAELATQMGRPADGLYYHAELLAKAGLLQRRDAGEVRRYRIAGTRGARLQLDYGRDAASRLAVARVADRLLSAARSDFRRALDAGDAVAEGPGRDLWAGRVKGWLQAKDLAEANRLLARLQALLQGPRRPGQDRLVSLTFVLAPLPARPSRRARDTDGGPDGD